MAIAVLDAGVVIGQLDSRDAHHDACVHALATHADHELQLPASAYAEVLVRPAAAGRLVDVQSALARLGVTIGAVDGACAERAARLRVSRRSLRLPDALVIAYAQVVEAEAVLTTDRRWRRIDQRVRVIG